MTSLAASTVASAAPPPPAGAASSSSSSGPSLWSKGGFGFKDILDIINPLQHLPIVGSIYRYITGDELSGGSRIVGDALYGGPIGLGVGVVSTVLTDSSGHDFGERALAAVFGQGSVIGKPATSPASALATATPKPAAPTAAALVPPPGAASAAGPQAAGLAKPLDPNRMAETLYRSPPPAGTPEQNFLAQNALYQREVSTVQGSNGQTLVNRPVPLELSSGLLPATRATAAAQAKLAPPAAPAQPQPGVTSVDPNANPIAQKMIDALDKYRQMKAQQEQQDNAGQAAAPKVDLSL